MHLGAHTQTTGTPIRNVKNEQKNTVKSTSTYEIWTPEQINTYLAERYPRHKLVIANERKS